MRMRITQALVILAAAVLLVSCAVPDTVVTAEVKTKMLANEAVRSTQLDVETKDGIVTITGTVDSQEVKDQALLLAKETKGAKDVVDMISVKISEHLGDAPDPDRTVGAVVDDAAITMRVKTQLLDDPSVKGTKIDVDTRDGVVYLTGTVKSQAEKEKANALAKGTRGVREVQANLTVMS
jgi:hyperosmotically inducible protein